MTSRPPVPRHRFALWLAIAAFSGYFLLTALGDLLPIEQLGASLESSKALLLKARAGDPVALEQLLDRYRASLRRWAHGRLPRWARDMSDTEDLIQETLAQTFKQLPRIELNDEDALHAYLRQAILNRIRNELRRASRHPVRAELDPEVPGASTSPLEAAIGAQRLERYERSLALLASCDAHAPEDPVEPAPTTGGATLRYDATAGHFIQNWKVPQTPGACYMVRMTTAQDGLALTARFKVR